MSEIDRFYWNLARGFYAVSTLFAIIGTIGNSIILLTTLRTTSLRSTCNFLIALCAIADICHQCGVLVKSPMIFDYYAEMDSVVCIGITFLPLFGIGVGCVSTLSIGLDRLFSVVFPIYHRNGRKRLFYFVSISSTFRKCSHFQFINIVLCKFRPVVCSILASFPGEAINYFLGRMIVVNLITAIVYLETWIRLRRHSSFAAMRRIQRSLFIVMAVDVSGWLSSPTMIVLLPLLSLNASQQFALIHFNTWFLNIALASKFFIYY
ncbi:hypothetical protein PMAYCL1PPCAC_09581, partial [Pristionchus mayeri]